MLELIKGDLLDAEDGSEWLIADSKGRLRIAVYSWNNGLMYPDCSYPFEDIMGYAPIKIKPKDIGMQVGDIVWLVEDEQEVMLLELMGDTVTILKQGKNVKRDLEDVQPLTPEQRRKYVKGLKEAAELRSLGD